MSLQELQSDFQALILSEQCTGADWVAQSSNDFSSKQRLAIYYNAYRIRLVDVLRDNFEHTSLYIGDEWFNQMATNYVQTHYSTHNNIGLYGQDFPKFLEEKLPVEDHEVAEISALDWALRRAFDGSNSDTMTMEGLQALAMADPNNTVLNLVPTFSFLYQNFNTIDIWHAIDQDLQPPVVERLSERVDVIVWRKEQSPHFRSVSAVESMALNYVCRGYTLKEIGIELEQSFPSSRVSMEFGQMLPRWILDGLLAV